MWFYGDCRLDTNDTPDFHRVEDVDLDNTKLNGVKRGGTMTPAERVAVELKILMHNIREASEAIVILSNISLYRQRSYQRTTG